MSTNNATSPTRIESLAEYQYCLERALRRRFGVGLAVYKIIKAITQLAGVLAAIYAMHLGAEPIDALLIAAFIWGGPEALEAYLVSKGRQHDSSDDSTADD